MLSTQPYKGVRDFFPEDLRIRDFIFRTWRHACSQFGYEEYDGPMLEPFELFAAKSGEELVNEQLYSFEDKGGRKIALRPEMTPTVSRMAAKKIQEQSQLPLKWFSVANFYRYEKPQKGRGREFYQLNVDMFGEDSVLADVEMLQINTEIMKGFNASPEMYQVRVNNRYFLDFYLSEIAKLYPDQKAKSVKILDKKSKISEEEFLELLEKAGLDGTQVSSIRKLMELRLEDLEKLSELPSKAKNLIELLTKATELGLPSIIFDPATVRGLDYYDGNVFEQFDMTPGNNRAMFGGGRYDGLISLFIEKQVPAVGFAQGDITLQDFLESWNLIPKFESHTKVLVTLFPDNSECQLIAMSTAAALRETGILVETYSNSSTDLTKQLKYADRKSLPYALIIGPDELRNKTYSLKSLKDASQKTVNSVDDLIKLLKNE